MSGKISEKLTQNKNKLIHYLLIVVEVLSCFHNTEHAYLINGYLLTHLQRLIKEVADKEEGGRKDLSS
jgi:hypothetical protein